MAPLECRARGKEVALLTSEPMEEKEKKKKEPSSQVESKAGTAAGGKCRAAGPGRSQGLIVRLTRRGRGSDRCHK